MPSNETITAVMQDAIALWKKLNIKDCSMEFSCGGDSMNEWSFHYYDNEGVELDVTEDTKVLDSYFDDAVFKNVEFYVNSDGYYIGESGDVKITLVDEDGEESKDGIEFQYSKDAQAEFSERYTQTADYVLTDDEYVLLSNKVQNLNAGWSDDGNVNYSNDCIITDDEEQLLNNLLRNINEFANNVDFSEYEGEPSDDFEWTTDIDGSSDKLQFTQDKKLQFNISRSFYVFRPSED